ncbi:DUF305 domain-containing protein [Streptosporangium roseum]|uniref:DUF305 domain-containing protein n=1 Tax=Streptosporangium roseum (strain ATCC 12428 / DSM 43021 / JCM 3005 / KCTC 9067 / NCIMB 10171 / NRRL 2505 / NI 9100) TaxID=479432 RepID=D2AXD4_STRRD|nr:DUF305 domain-containing protein [Streptosporangium roseum]ACZ83114.1 conserved hypothetical protein [Streptosporangium roseum DSM 43021]
MTFTNRSAARRLALTAAGTGMLVLLTACGGDDRPATAPTGTPGGTRVAATSPQPSASFNDADVTFAQMMIPHHEQAVEMAELAESRAGDPEVKELAAKIKVAQDPEIAIMNGWLSAWGKPTGPEEGHEGHDMPGMMTGEDMAKLRESEGAEFDRMFAKLMIAHHKGAIEMARTEQARGSSPEAKALARNIETTQQAEVEQLQRLLDRL